MKKMYLLLLGLFLCTATGIAQEGMWLLNQIGQLDLKEKGLQIGTDRIYDPSAPSLYKAVVQLGGGTASFVSPEGLLLTNHHVAFTALQRSSSTEADFLSNGFLARTQADEIQAPGYTARLLLEMKDVTSEVLAAVQGISDPIERDRKTGEKIVEMTDPFEEDRDDISAVVSEMFNGKQYMLFVYKVFQDIRIVYAPPRSIGEYGGDVDNWMWPRHTGDFSFLRVYVSPDGAGAPYDPANVPYEPEVWLKVTTTDLDDGDFTFVVGFPGFTTRYRTSNSAYWNLTYNYPFTISNLTEVIELAEQLTKDDPEGRLLLAGLTNGLANALKNTQGKVDGMKRTHFVEKKTAFEKEFMQWVNSDPERKARYGTILDDIKALYTELKKTKERNDVFGVLQGLAGTPLNVAASIYLNVKELEKPDDERAPGFDESSLQRASDRLEFAYSSYYEPFDKALMVRVLKMADALPDGQRITELDYILEDPAKSIEQFVDEAFSKTRLLDLEYARGLFNMDTKQLEALGDPFITMTANLYQLSEDIGDEYQEFAAKVTDLRKHYLDAIYEWKGTGLYPDANGTMRFTSGPVKGYSPEDAVWNYPFTTLKGVVAKDMDEEPFDAPDGLVKLYKNKDFGKYTDPELNDVPVAFLHQIDIAGGNSGSPVLNARGELIGVVFDGNYEAMISDWQYDYDLQRAISVDIRYVLFVTEKFGKAGFILEEMGIF